MTTHPEIIALSRNPLAEHGKSSAPGFAEDNGDGCHSARRYLHIEAVFVFDGALDHLSAASGQGQTADPQHSHSKMKKGLQS